LDNLAAIASQFSPAQILNIQPLGNGNINDTFRVEVSSAEHTRVDHPYFVLQRINTEVFRQPQLVMQNMRILTEHIHQRCSQANAAASECNWQMPQVLLTHDAQDHWIDAAGGFWRAMSFIDGTQSFDTIQNLDHAREVGYALGTFHRLISDLPPHQLADTLEGFHITPQYLQHYHQVLAQTRVESSPELDYGLQFVRDRQAGASVLEQAKVQGKLPLRLMHGDPKINNILIHSRHNRAISIIDLDTVKPGLIHYDIGDCLRSACNALGEETDRWQAVEFETDFCQAILASYLAQTRDCLTAQDYEYLYDAIRLIAFELGLRFLTDYLAGNTYFKVQYSEHNLVRALVQFKLTESIESQHDSITKIIQDAR
jgi:Ser/Thr protein kinase RdoA (MazF antagonist)